MIERIVIRVLNATKIYNSDRVLEIARLELSPGERVLVWGANGSGKSTLLRVCAGISGLTSGEILWSPEVKQSGIAFVPQVGGLYSDLSLARNLFLRQQLWDVDFEEFAHISSIHDLGLVPLAAKRFGDLSGGFQRLASVAITLAVRPKILFLDEPLSGLDDFKAEQLSRHLVAAAKELDLLLVASPQNSAFFDANRSVSLAEGRLT